MKKSLLLMLVAVTAICVAPSKASAQGGSVSVQVFYDDLSPYGTWVNSSSYGYVWVPNAGPGFVPYESGGHWVYTEFGWTWVSDYPWGWAPFHYGRWYMDPVYGAMWVPDTEWGPAWVTWRHADGYYGWAPMEPGIGVSVYINGGYNIPPDRWCFVHDRDFGREDIHNHIVPRSENTVVMHNSTPINNTVVDHNRNQTYVAGPPSNDVQRATGRPINTVAVHDAGKPAQALSGNKLEIYRPRVEKTAPNGQKAAPPKVAEMKDLKPAAQRNTAQPARTEPAKAPVKAEPAKGQERVAPPQKQSPVNNVRPQQAPNKVAPATAPVRQATPQQRAPVSQPSHQNAPPPVRQQPAPVQRQVPQQQPDRHTQQQQPMRQAPPQQAPVHQALPPQRMEQPRQVPQQQPMHQAPPQQQPVHQAPPQQQPMRQAEPQQQPRPEPMREAPRSEPPHPAPQRGPK